MDRKDQQQTYPIIDIKKYGGKQVAMADGKIIAAGRTLPEVIKKLKKQEPQRPLSEVVFFVVPKSLYTIYHA